MIALCFLLGGLLAGSLSLNAWLTYRTVRGVEEAAKSEIGSTHFESALELARFELEQTRKALSATEARAAALEEIVADEINDNPNADLDRADVRSRLLRAAKAWAAADKARTPVAEDVPAASEPGAGPDTASVSGVDGPNV